MTWIRFGRNEPLAPSVPMPSNQGGEVDLHRFRRDGTLLLFFAPPGGLETCPELLLTLMRAPLQHDAELLVVTDQESDFARQHPATLSFDHDGSLRALYAGLMAIDSADRPMLFVLDRDGSPVYAWVGACQGAQEVAEELAQKLQSAAFLCPECSVPDPNSAVMWDVMY